MLPDGHNHINEQEMKAAFGYFDQAKETSSSMNTNSGFVGYNKNGIIEYVAMSSYNSEDELDVALASLCNITVSAVLAYAGDDDSKKVDPNTWETGYKAITNLFCHSNVLEKLEYNEKNMGREAINKVMEVGFDTVGTPSGALEKDIDRYLQAQGAIINDMGFEGSKNNPYIIFGYSNFDLQGKRVCCIKLIYAYFTKEGVLITRTCKDPTLRFNFDFKVTRNQASFMLANWQSGGDFRNKVNDFIKKHEQQDLPYIKLFETGRKFKV